MAYLLADQNKPSWQRSFNRTRQKLTLLGSTEQGLLRASVVDGENVAVRWHRKTLHSIKETEGFGRYLCAYLTDPLGNMYARAAVADIACMVRTVRDTSWTGPGPPEPSPHLPIVACRCRSASSETG